MSEKTEPMTFEAIKRLKEKALEQGWVHKNMNTRQVCTACNGWMDHGFVMAPSYNYGICVQCADIEFNGKTPKPTEIY